VGRLDPVRLLVVVHGELLAVGSLLVLAVVLREELVGGEWRLAFFGAFYVDAGPLFVQDGEALGAPRRARARRLRLFHVRGGRRDRPVRAVRLGPVPGDELEGTLLDFDVLVAAKGVQPVAALLGHLVEALQLDLAVDRLPLAGVNLGPPLARLPLAVELLADLLPGVAGGAQLGGLLEQGGHVGTHVATSQDGGLGAIVFISTLPTCPSMTPFRKVSRKVGRFFWTIIAPARANGRA